MLLLLAYCLMGFFASGDLFFLVLVFRWEFLIPISALLLLFLLNRWFGDLMLLDKYERAVYRFVFPSLLLATYVDVLTYESAMYSAEESIISSTAFSFFLYPSLALLFLYLLFSTKDDEHCPSIMLTLGIILFVEEYLCLVIRTSSCPSVCLALSLLSARRRALGNV